MFKVIYMIFILVISKKLGLIKEKKNKSIFINNSLMEHKNYYLGL